MAGTPFERVAVRHFPSSRLVRAWPLEGGVSAQVTAMELADSTGARHTVVVRQHGPRDLARNPNVTAHELALLKALYGAGLPVPEPLALDTSGDMLPSPYLIQSYIDGETIAAPRDPLTTATTMSATLAQIHCADIPRAAVPFLEHYPDRIRRHVQHTPGELAHLVDAERVLAVVRADWSRPARNRETILHGDYWIGNLIWEGDQLAGVVDWEDAAFGDPLADLAIARLELLWAFGDDALRAFTKVYAAEMSGLDTTDLPYWDLSISIRRVAHIPLWGVGPERERAMVADANRFIRAALRAVGS
ncbi:MAG: phosphotransferase [Chloroflexi bacterium]|nr:phosphotransferase [Chloroflexota bacterium]